MIAAINSINLNEIRASNGGHMHNYSGEIKMLPNRRVGKLSRSVAYFDHSQSKVNAASHLF